MLEGKFTEDQWKLLLALLMEKSRDNHDPRQVPVIGKLMEALLQFKAVAADNSSTEATDTEPSAGTD